MGILFIGAVCTAGGLYYLSRLAPRVASRMAGQQAGRAAAQYAHSNRLPYHEFEHGFLASMTKDEALLILGFNDKVGSIRELPVPLIKERHRNLIKGHHSDVNGSPYLASKINEARAVLLNGRKS